jgi:hypothetical protein
MNYIANTLGGDVLQDWDNFFETKLLDYYTVKENLVGEWFVLDRVGNGVTWAATNVDGKPVKESMQVAVTTSRLPLVLRSIRQEYVFVCCMIGPNMKGNYYSSPTQELYIVNIYDKTAKRFMSAQELTRFVNKIATNPYGKKFHPGPILGLIDFKTALQAVQDLPEGEDTSMIEDQVLSSLEMLREMPSMVNPAIERAGVLCSGLYGYTFNYN